MASIETLGQGISQALATAAGGCEQFEQGRLGAADVVEGLSQRLRALHGLHTGPLQPALDQTVDALQQGSRAMHDGCAQFVAAVGGELANPHLDMAGSHLQTAADVADQAHAKAVAMRQALGEIDLAVIALQRKLTAARDLIAGVGSPAPHAEGAGLYQRLRLAGGHLERYSEDTGVPVDIPPFLVG